MRIKLPSSLRNGGFPLKTHQMFYSRTSPEKFENATITSHFGFVFEKKDSGREITWLWWRHRFQKAPFSNCFPSTRKRIKCRRFQISLVWRAPFSWRIRMDGRSNRRKKAAFSVSPALDPGVTLLFWLSNVNSVVRAIVILTACVSSAFPSSHWSTAFLARASLQSVL